MNQPVIHVENLGKAYRIGLKEEIPDTLMGAVRGIFRNPLKNLRNLRRLDTFAASGDVCSDDILWALKDVSFDVQEGDVVGIIGRNGAGKSTLLKILSRITEPTHGRAVIRGRISSLLEVGTGFHPELSGRDNIYMNGTILGMKKREIDRKFDEIVEFSGVEKFLDTPVKRYSSGMTVRLAFAVAAHLEPEILIIDEVLAVGDAEFQKKCLGKMQDVADCGRTVLFVSHNMAAVQSLCNRGIMFAAGALVANGNTDEVLRNYRSSVSSELTERNRADRLRASRFVRRVDLLDELGMPCSSIPLGGCFRLRIQFEPESPVTNPLIGLGIDALAGGRVLSLHTPLSSQVIGAINGPCYVNCHIRDFPLSPGEYTLRLVLTENRQELEVIDDATQFAVFDADTFGEGRGFHRGVCVARSVWSRDTLASTSY